MMRPQRLLLGAILVLLSAGPALAQRTTATVRGAVRDATQAVLPGVTVTATNVETGAVRTPPVPTDPLTGQPFPGNQIPANRLSPGGQSFLSLYPLPNVTPGQGSCNNWVTSIASPINFAQQSLRMDWTITDASRLMVRYTRHRWQNDSPSIHSNLWGDDPFPAVDSNWDQPSQSFVASLNQTIGNTANNSLQFSYSANKIDITRGGLTPELNAEILGRIQPLFGYGNKQYGDNIGHPVFWGGAAQKLPAAAPVPRDPPAAATYKKHCQLCHLDGNVPLEPLNFTDRKWVHGSRLNDVIRVIRDGVPGTAMIAYKDILTAEEIRAVAEYVRAFDKSLKPGKR